MTEQIDFGSIGMALSCTLFLEGAFKHYAEYIPPVAKDKLELIHEWNTVLIHLLQDARYKEILGDFGCQLVKYSKKWNNFYQKCVDIAPDAAVQALHYVLRFQ